MSNKRFLPKEVAEDDLFIKLIELIDYLEIAEIEEASVVKNRTKDPAALSGDVIQELVAEYGYSYIIDAFNLSDEELSAFISYLPLLQLMKGSRAGLELAFRLLKASIAITEWWEMDPIGDPHTFSADLDIDLSTYRPDTVSKLREFFRHYIFPKLVDFVLNFSLSDTVALADTLVPAKGRGWGADGWGAAYGGTIDG